MFNALNSSPSKLHQHNIESATASLTAAMSQLEQQATALQEAMRNLTWTGRWSEEVRSDIESEITKIRQSKDEVDGQLKAALTQHAYWIGSERRRLEVVERRVRTVLEKRRSLEGNRLEYRYPPSGTWHWDDLARDEGISTQA